MSECVPSPTNSEWGSTAWAQNVYIEPMQIDRWSETSRQWEIMDIRSMWITVGRCMRWRNADVRDNFAVNKGDSEVRISQILGNISDWTTNSKSSSGQSSQLGRTVAGWQKDSGKLWMNGRSMWLMVERWMRWRNADVREVFSLFLSKSEALIWGNWDEKFSGGNSEGWVRADYRREIQMKWELWCMNVIEF